MGRARIYIDDTSLRTTLRTNNDNSQLTQAFTATIFAAVVVPSGSTGVYIVPDTANAGAITFKGIVGDTGINIPKAVPSFMSLDPAAASFGLLCASTQSITFTFV
jgi:hypothetical protein